MLALPEKQDSTTMPYKEDADIDGLRTCNCQADAFVSHCCCVRQSTNSLMHDRKVIESGQPFDLQFRVTTHCARLRRAAKAYHVHAPPLFRWRVRSLSVVLTIESGHLVPLRNRAEASQENQAQREEQLIPRQPTLAGTQTYRKTVWACLPSNPSWSEKKRIFTGS